MGLITIEIQCPKCDSHEVRANYIEEYRDIKCICFDCYERGFLKDFEYMIDGDCDL